MNDASRADAVRIISSERSLSALEAAAINYVAAKEDFDRARYGFKPWKTYGIAYRRLKLAVEALEKARTE